MANYLWTLLQKLEHASLKDLIANRQHVVPIGDSSTARPAPIRRIHAASRQSNPRYRPRQDRHGENGHLRAAKSLTRTAHAGGKRPPVGSVCSAKLRNNRAVKSVTSARLGASNPSCDRLGRPETTDAALPYQIKANPPSTAERTRRGCPTPDTPRSARPSSNPSRRLLAGKGDRGARAHPQP